MPCWVYWSVGLPDLKIFSFCNILDILFRNFDLPSWLPAFSNQGWSKAVWALQLVITFGSNRWRIKSWASNSAGSLWEFEFQSTQPSLMFWIILLQSPNALLTYNSSNIFTPALQTSAFYDVALLQAPLSMHKSLWHTYNSNYLC